MTKPTNALDHDGINRLLPLLGDDPARERLAQASRTANSAVAALAAEIATSAARADAIERQIVRGVTNPTARTKLAAERQRIETEALFLPGRLEVATVAQARAELAYLAHVHAAAYAAERAAQAAHERTHAAWVGPARRDYELSNTTEPETVRARAALQEQLAPLVAANAAAAQAVERVAFLRQVLAACAARVYGAGVDLARPQTWETPIREGARRAVAAWRTGGRDLAAHGAAVDGRWAPLAGARV